MKRPIEFTVKLAAPSTEFNQPFVQGMADRMAVSFHKYGAMASADIDVRANIERRLALYEETGNTEWLMDVANYALIEFSHPTHPDAHYRPTDSDESPGRADALGNFGAERNL